VTRSPIEVTALILLVRVVLCFRGLKRFATD